MLKTTHAMMLASAILASGAFCALSLADAPKPPTTAPAGRAGGRNRGNAAPAGLGQAMSEMGKSLQALKAEVVDASKLEQSLKDIATLQRDVAISKLLVPPTVSRLAADKQKEALESYRSMMSGLLRTLLDLEDAVVANKPDDVKKCLDQVEAIEKQGHAEFRNGQ